MRRRPAGPPLREWLATHRRVCLGLLATLAVSGVLLVAVLAKMGASGPNDYSVEAGGVALVTYTYFAFLMWVMWFTRKKLAASDNALFLPGVCFVVGFFSLLTAYLLVKKHAQPGVPLVSAFSKTWWSFGWHTGELVFMGVRIDSPVAYGLIVNYQITRCVLGSLLSNAFAPYLTTLQSNLVKGSEKGERGGGRAGVLRLLFNPPFPINLLLARLLADMYSFASGLTDLILYLSAFDIFLVSGVATMVTNWLVTWLLLDLERERAGASHAGDLAHVVQRDLDQSHGRPLLIGGHGLRL